MYEPARANDHTPEPPVAKPSPPAWDRYLDSRGPRAHGDLLKQVDAHVHGEARRVLGRNHPMLEEVAQEALVGAARRISTGERPDFPAAYLRKIVHNKVADMLRRENARRDREQQQWTPEVGEADASMSAEWHDFLDTIRDIVSSDEFWTLILHYHFDYSYGEIGDLLQKEANAVRQIAHRGRRKCREHLTRLEGRVPAWVLLPDAGPESGGRVADSSDGDQPGRREPRSPDPADRSRRPSAGSDSAQAAAPPPIDLPITEVATGFGATPTSTWRRVPRLRPSGPNRPFGSPTTVVPLTLLLALPLLFQVDRALDASVVGPAIQTATIVDDADGAGQTPPPSGPTISVTPSTAPTAQREAPSTSEPDHGQLRSAGDLGWCRRHGHERLGFQHDRAGDDEHKADHHPTDGDLLAGDDGAGEDDFGAANDSAAADHHGSSDSDDHDERGLDGADDSAEDDTSDDATGGDDHDRAGHHSELGQRHVEHGLSHDDLIDHDVNELDVDDVAKHDLIQHDIIQYDNIQYDNIQYDDDERAYLDQRSGPG